MNERRDGAGTGKLQMKDIAKRHHLKHSKKAGAVNHNCGM